jgi:hypothetical protein
MVISFTINRTTVELNTGGSVWIETPRRQIHAFRGIAFGSLKEATSDGARVREGFGWVVISNPTT